jgi:hypothetical protein
MAWTRTEPKDNLYGVFGGTITFGVICKAGGRIIDPKNNTVYLDLYYPAYLTDGTLTAIETDITMTRQGTGQYDYEWTVPSDLTIADEYIAIYKANFGGIIDGEADSTVVFDDELFAVGGTAAPIIGVYPPYATASDVRMLQFNIDSYLPDTYANSTTQRDAIIYHHLERASDKLREEINLLQNRSNSSDRREYVCSRAIFSIMLASRGQSGSAVTKELLDFWHDRAEEILAQLKREGLGQAAPFGRS